MHVQHHGGHRVAVSPPLRHRALASTLRLTDKHSSMSRNPWRSVNAAVPQYDYQSWRSMTVFILHHEFDSTGSPQKKRPSVGGGRGNGQRA